MSQMEHVTSSIICACADSGTAVLTVTHCMGQSHLHTWSWDGRSSGMQSSGCGRWQQLPPPVEVASCVPSKQRCHEQHAVISQTDMGGLWLSYAAANQVTPGESKVASPHACHTLLGWLSN